ncbi:MAG: sensor histidine kinase [Adhaeribacter sp.]
MIIDQKPQPATPEPGHACPVQVLLVDDKPENLISLEALLASPGDQVTYLFANSGEEALKMALQEDLALILLDVQMPGMNGYEVAAYLRHNSRTRDIPVIFVTAIDEESTLVVEGFEAGAVDFLFKPLHPFITRAKVASFINFYLQKKELEKANQLMQQINTELEERVQERTQAITRINKDLENFVYTASHDLKSPISDIEGLVRFLQETLAENDQVRGDTATILELIDKSIKGFHKTLSDLTDIANLGYDQDGAQATVGFQEVLEDVRLSIHSQIQQCGAQITLDFSQCPGVVFSRKNLRSIVFNLLSNAVKYRCPDRQPQIHLSTYPIPGYVVLAIHDNGMGIRPEDHHKVFTMFTRLHHDHTDGTGVGMTIVKRIVENNEGKIELESEPDKGAVFRVYFKTPG